jgi:hypothetical protein
MDIKTIMRFGILVFAICMLCIPLVLAADPASAEPGKVGPGNTGTANVIIIPSLLPGAPAPALPQVDKAAIATDEERATASSTEIGPLAILATPILQSPANNTHFTHYPRTTTLAWKTTSTHTNQYKVERQYYAGGIWYSYPDDYTTPPASSYTFNFVGDQRGRWRVTAYDTTGQYTHSSPTAWRVFDYVTGFSLATPTLVSPANATHFYNYPRTTTVAWKPVPGAHGYKVDVEYYYGVWSAPSTTTVSGASFTFGFVGMQPGRWRVSALGGSDPDALYYDSPYSAWRYFTYHI